MKIREILVVPHMHHDVGYTHTPAASLRLHERAIREAIALCERDLDRDSPEAFHWTVEISRPLVEFLHHATAEEIARLQTVIARGRLSVTAGYMHMTQLIGHEEYLRFFRPVREFRERYGLPVSVVQHGDINGLSWGVVPLMREAGLDCLVMALNPDHGRAPFEQPSAFTWEGPDGSQVLVWLGLPYNLGGYPWGLAEGSIDAAVAPLRDLVARLEERADYPFDFLVFQAAEDNMLPQPQIIEAVRAWNAAGHQPPMRVVTMDTAMDRVRAQARESSIPVVRGEWADWWAHGHGSSAYEVGVSRLARAEVRTAETVRALALLAGPDTSRHPLGAGLPVLNWYRIGNIPPLWTDWQERVDAVYDNLLLFEEHTWGPFESVTRPFGLFTQAHWNGKARFAFDAASEAHDLAREGLADLAATLPPGPAPTLVVANPLGIRRHELVPVRESGQDYQVWVQDIPPLGVKVLPWSPPEPPTPVPANAPPGAPVVIENAFYRLAIDPRTAAIVHLYDKELDKEWVDGTARAGIGAVVYEEPQRDADHPALRLDRRHFHPDNPGPPFNYTVAEGRGVIQIAQAAHSTMLTVEATAPTLSRIRTTVTLYESVKRIDVDITLDKQENFGIEGIYVLFPFALDAPTFQLETANAVFRAGQEQLPDTCRDWYSIQHGAAVGDGATSVLWATREAPLVQLGGFHTGEWARTLQAPRGHLYAWLMNNLYFTNFKASQGGQMEFHFRFTTQAGQASEAEVRNWGAACAVPPLTRVVASPAGIALGDYEWLTVAPSTVHIQLLKPAWDVPGALVLRLKETSGQATQMTISGRWPGQVEMISTDFLEITRGAPLGQDTDGFHLTLTPHQLATVLILPAPPGPPTASSS